MSWNYHDIGLDELLQLLVETESIFTLIDVKNNNQIMRIGGAGSIINAKALEYDTENTNEIFNIVLTNGIISKTKYILRNVKYIGHVAMTRRTDNQLIEIDYKYIQGTAEAENTELEFKITSNKRIKLKYINGFIGIDKNRSNNRFKLLKANTESDSEYEINLENINNIRSPQKIAKMLSWFRNRQDILKIFGVSYENFIHNICLEDPKFYQCQKYCPIDSKNTNCIRGYIKQCFDSSENNIYTTDICKKFCDNNKLDCDIQFREKKKYCNDINSLTNPQNYCYKFYDKNFQNCSQYQNIDETICRNGRQIYDNLCNKTNIDDPRCSCISEKQIKNNRIIYFDNLKKNTKDNLQKQVKKILDDGIIIENNIKRNLTQQERIKIKNIESAFLSEIDNYYEKHREQIAPINTNCLDKDCSISGTKRALLRCSISNLVLANCFNDINILAFLNGTIRDSRIDQRCIISINGNCENGKCPNPFICENNYCVNRMTNNCINDAECGINRKCNLTTKICENIIDDCKKCQQDQICENNICKNCGFFSYKEDNNCKQSWIKIGLLSFIIFVIIIIIILIILFLIYKK
jgi:hypothetical protein